ncbi:MAG: hypothetical protein ACKVUS_13475 [Saprospiraceae bacterium]
MLFQLNDYVRVKPGVLLEETGEPVPGWEGQITEIPTNPTNLVYLIELDALSLEQLPEKYLADCIEESDLAIAYYFAEEDLEHAVRRDTDDQRAAAIASLENLFFPPEDELDGAQVARWLGEFEQSPQYATLGPDEQESVYFIIEIFSEYAFNYRGDQPDDWSVGTVREVCLELFPRKFTAKTEDFEQIGAVLIQFFGFLDEKKYLKNADALRREVKKIAPEIVLRAKDPRNWGMAKSFAMGAAAAGVDLGDSNAMNGFMADYNANLLPNLGFSDFGTKKSQLLRPAPENPFKNIARNQIVKVKYPDGNIREGKFKRLEDELRAGKCELLA